MLFLWQWSSRNQVKWTVHVKGSVCDQYNITSANTPLVQASHIAKSDNEMEKYSLPIDIYSSDTDVDKDNAHMKWKIVGNGL